jgi:hypothetical protein
MVTAAVNFAVAGLRALTAFSGSVTSASGTIIIENLFRRAEVSSMKLIRSMCKDLFDQYFPGQR